jgi:hypothetical protein
MLGVCIEFESRCSCSDSSLLAEYQSAGNESGRVVRYKFAFRWCEDQGEPWWTKLPSKEALTDKMDIKVDSDRQSDQILEQPASTCDKLTFGHNNTPPPGSNTIDCDVNPYPGRPLFKFPRFGYSFALGIISDNEEEDRKRNDILLSMRCQTCAKDSPKVFSVSWACLNADCTRFWVQMPSHESSLLPPNLAYEPSFLQLPEYKNGPLGFADLKLTLPVHESTQDPGTGAVTDYHFTRGLHCRLCGRLSCR